MKTFTATCQGCGKPWRIFTGTDMPDDPCPFCGSDWTTYARVSAVPAHQQPAGGVLGALTPAVPVKPARKKRAAMYSNPSGSAPRRVA